MTKRMMLILGLFCIFLAACNGSGGANGGSGNGIQLPPAWTPTAIGVLEGEDEGTWLPCDNAPPSQLQVGDNATLDQGIDFAIRLRSEPGLTGTIISSITHIDILEVVNGPACYDHLVWWEMRSIGTGISGWTAEGNSFGPWILRVD